MKTNSISSADLEDSHTTQKIRFTVNSSSSSYNEKSESDQELTEVIVACAAGISLILATVVGNFMVVLAVVLHKPLRKVQNFLIISLAAADLSVAVLVMPLSLVHSMMGGHWLLGRALCDLFLTSDIFCCTASILNLCAIALDRYWAIKYPLQYVNRRTVRLICGLIAAVYSLSALISIPPLLGWREYSPANSTTCLLSKNQVYVVFSALGSFIIPAIVILTVYLQIYLAIRQRLRRKLKNSLQQKGVIQLLDKISKSTSDEDLEIDKQQPNNTTTHHSSNSLDQNILQEAAKRKLNRFWSEKQKISLSKERKATRVMGIIIGVFMMFWLPFFIMYLLSPFCVTLGCMDLDRRFEAFLVWLGYINSALNPIIYTIFNSDFRTAFINILKIKFIR